MMIQSYIGVAQLCAVACAYVGVGMEESRQGWSRCERGQDRWGWRSVEGADGVCTMTKVNNPPKGRIPKNVG